MRYTPSRIALSGETSSPGIRRRAIYETPWCVRSCWPVERGDVHKMKDDRGLQVRVTGVLIEQGHILIVKQRVSGKRAWSLPGGRVKQGETLEEAMLREMEEETGLRTRIARLLYLCEKPEATPPLLHISFLLEKLGGEIRLPSNEFEDNRIHDVRMVPIDDLTSYQFSKRFMDLARDGFPDAGSYKGHKSMIGL